MTNIDLPDKLPGAAPLPPRAPQKPPRRPTPCAGLFGWRKDGTDKTGKAPGQDYPIA